VKVGIEWRGIGALVKRKPLVRTGTGVLMSPQDSAADLNSIVAGLVDGWCANRNLHALRLILQAYPMRSGLSDEWYDLRDALTFVRADCRDTLSPDESDRLEHAIALADSALVRD
jgi:hypothetical protein